MTAISYNSCRNRHCPKCQANARVAGSRRANGNFCPLRYVHVVFTLPRQLAPLALQNKRLIYDLLFRASAERCSRSLAIPGISAPRSASSACCTPGTRNCSIIRMSIAWFPPAVSLRTTPAGSPLAAASFFPSTCSAVSSAASSWPVSSNAFHRRRHSTSTDSSCRLLEPRAFARLAAGAVPPRLGRLLQTALRRSGTCAALSRRLHPSRRHLQHRLVALADGNVTFRWRDSAHGNKKRLMTLSVDEFLRRFLLHVLPPGFVRIRHFGFLANRSRATRLPLCWQLLGGSLQNTAPPVSTSTDENHSLWNCPRCGGTMRVVERLTAAQLLLRSPPQLKPVCSMKLYLHLRPWSVLRRVRGFLASSGRNPLRCQPLQPLHQVSASQHAPHPPFSYRTAAQLCLCLIPLHPFRPIQNT